MIRYVKYQNNGHIQGVAGKWYLRVKNGEQIDLDGLAEHMSLHNTPFSKGAIKGILTDMVNCIKELLLDSKTVKIGDLAIFSLGLHCKGATTAAEATIDNITGFSFNARGTGKLSTKQIAQEARFKELDEYSV
ncbi:MAG: DNA-binding protein [Prevotella sp.]|nr:DNA-binding protein [Prevotella sp.]MCF0208936.1 DNA-binding protein [Bacteroidaceae bacterium]